MYAGAAARGPASRVEAFTGALLRELALRADAADATFGRVGEQGRGPLETLYLGGGTPTLLPAASIAGIIGLVRERFGLANGAEVTIESNPGPDERGDANALVATGVNRLSLGAQAFDEGLLRRLGRRHRPTDVAAAIAEAREAGIASVSVDLLYDVPGQTPAAWAASLDATIGLGVDHVSAYALTLDDPDEEGLTGPLGDHLPTRVGARRWREAAVGDQDEDAAATMYRTSVERLRAAGFRGYEISNWARPGHESRHNLAYWRRLPHEAVGPGAHAFDGATRRWNAARLEGYLRALAPGDGAEPVLPPGGAEPVDAATAAAEQVILALRLDTGVPEAAARSGPLEAHLEWALATGMLERFVDGAAERYRLTTDGRLLSNELFARLV
ncbi:MAG TPA: coproporphyrinogen-III oxidase family protein [Candidatus Limnocylindrales bacterium]|nr:coproporphyrinogen-III oxidase family protein [Candidatus Limnocylindrales bacterium]